MKHWQIFTIGFFTFFLLFVIFNQNVSLSSFVFYEEIISPLANETNTPTPIRTPTALPTPSLLAHMIEASLNGTQGTYGIVVKHLSTNERYARNEHTSFTAASLYKLWVMAEVMIQIEQGKLQEDQVITADIASLNSEFFIDPEYADRKEGILSLSINEALENMITVSDNYAALLLTRTITLSAVEEFLIRNDLRESRVGKNGNPPIVTPYDIAKFYEKLYAGQLASKESTDKMIDLLKAQSLNEKLPKYLPKGTILAHKTGELESVSHDAGIVYGKNGNYIITVLSKSDSPGLANDRIASVSQKAYTYFNP